MRLVHPSAEVVRSNGVHQADTRRAYTKKYNELNVGYLSDAASRSGNRVTMSGIASREVHGTFKHETAAVSRSVGTTQPSGNVFRGSSEHLPALTKRATLLW